MSVHKAQGSEFERIRVVLPARDSRVLTRELLHTALTRARASVCLWARAAVLRDRSPEDPPRHHWVSGRSPAGEAGAV